MTNLEAIKILDNLKPGDYSNPYEKGEAIVMAISALQAQDSPKPTAESAQNVQNEDLISRKAAIDAVENIDCSDGVGISALKCEAVDDVVTAIKALPSAQPQPQWIPVSERLPDMWDERYLVSLAWGGIGVMEYKSTGFHNYGSFTPVPIESITAWMPLSEPYRAERRTDETD